MDGRFLSRDLFVSIALTRMDDPHMVYGHELLHAVTPGRDKSTRSSLAEIPHVLHRMQMTQQNQTTVLCDLTILPSLRSGLAWLLGAQILHVDIVLGSVTTRNDGSRQARVQPGCRAVSAFIFDMAVRTVVAVYFRIMRGLGSRLSFGRESMSREGVESRGRVDLSGQGSFSLASGTDYHKLVA
ncbi:hypothetical protein N7486_008575 [Penicillium sp. IBT 16267x]|nr:hypothetical protein N7486_008575 [Penicillium sp. IBT 16267x]